MVVSGDFKIRGRWACIGNLTYPDLEDPASSLQEKGFTREQASSHCWFFDSQGLLTKERICIPEHKRPFTHDDASIENFAEAIYALKPTAIIGCAGQVGVFSEELVKAMAELNERPIIFALSNPTAKAECSAEEAYRWSDGRAIFASGSTRVPRSLSPPAY